MGDTVSQDTYTYTHTYIYTETHIRTKRFLLMSTFSFKILSFCPKTPSANILPTPNLDQGWERDERSSVETKLVSSAQLQLSALNFSHERLANQERRYFFSRLLFGKPHPNLRRLHYPFFPTAIFHHYILVI